MLSYGPLYIYFNIFLSFFSDLRAGDPGTTPALRATPVDLPGRLGSPEGRRRGP
ncbi:hypothetical protein TUZN_1516 [Thermoproteus uzoniensis 768-20]|uniref:Uncharacterized protein n=1 Tax=Thermoproteus uzoniensis (strain 768-20) TaxID=999630 RepID=F2L260_THEU7|nr:hypothetical protein TUZN_1516 [Thermoproteus uzoniensis 768-20]